MRTSSKSGVISSAAAVGVSARHRYNPPVSYPFRGRAPVTILICMANGTGDFFLIEAPQILNQSTASCQQDDIMSALIRLAQIFNNGSHLLDPCQAGMHHSLSQRSSADRRQDITNCDNSVFAVITPMRIGY